MTGSQAKTAEAVLEEALIRCFGHPGPVPATLLLHSHVGQVLNSQRYTATVMAYG